MKRTRKKKQLCKYGHNISIVGRDKWGACMECRRIYDRNYRLKHPEQQKIKKKKYNDAHKVEIAKKCHEYYEMHKELISLVTKEWQNNNKISIAEKAHHWRNLHPELARMHKMKCKTNRNLRIVVWTDWDIINEFERNKPENFTTDHIIPLQNKKISGLHVSWNLQYLTKENNSKKHNKCDLLQASEWYGKILEKAGLK